MGFLSFLLLLVFITPIGFYLYHIIKRMLFAFTNGNRRNMKRVSLVITLLLIFPLRHIYSVWTVIIVHFIVLSLLMDGVHQVIRKIRKDKIPHVFIFLYNWCILPLLITVLAIGYGSYNIQQVVKTSYVLESDKEMRVEGYKIAFISDLHYGNAMGVEALKRICKEVEAQNPDMIILGGDIVDEGTSLAQLQEAIAILGSMRSDYGTFYVYGNHDLSNYSTTPNYSKEQLVTALQSSSIHILGEETYAINDEFHIVGRLDYSLLENKNRDITKEQAVLKNIGSEDFFLLLDHQPKGLEFNDQVGYDLQLSGHTHGGQFFPVAQLGLLTGIMELDYGYEKLDYLQVIVSSGISGWGFPIRTQAHSEYVMIDIK